MSAGLSACRVSICLESFTNTAFRVPVCEPFGGLDGGHAGTELQTIRQWRRGGTLSLSLCDLDRCTGPPKLC